MRLADCQASRKLIYFIGVFPLIWDSGYRRKNSQFCKLLLRFTDRQPSWKLIYFNGFFPPCVGIKIRHEIKQLEVFKRPGWDIWEWIFVLLSHRGMFLCICDFQANNDILAFLSGMPVTRNTKYLDLKNAVSPWDVGSFKPTCDPCFLFFTGFSYAILPLFEIIQGIP